MKKYINKIIKGDCLEVMKNIKKETIDCCITDPPYGIGLNTIRGDENISLYKKSFPLIYSLLKKEAWMITFLSPKYIKQIIEIGEEVGLTYRWVGFNYYPNMFKQKPQPFGFNRHELWMIFSKGTPKKTGCIKDVVHIIMDKSSRKDRGHPTQKPLKCYNKLIKASTKEGDVILDPFIGSGNLGIVAKIMKRNFIGIEIESEYCKLARKNIRNYKNYIKIIEAIK